MSNGQYKSKRVRAWVLLKADNPEKVARKIYSNLGKVGKSNYVVIRADVVEGEYNIVVPIDTTPANFEQTVEMVASHTGVTSHTTLRAIQFNPGPTYLAHGFIQTSKEVADRNKWLRPDDVGRIQKKSPGDNPWG
jgi:hypothetical protein